MMPPLHLQLVALLAVAPATCSVSLYPTLQSPEEHPLYLRRAVRPPGYAAFGSNGYGTLAVRGFPASPNGTLLNITQVKVQRRHHGAMCFSKPPGAGGRRGALR